MKVRVYNKTLCPDLWDEDQNLKPEVYQSLFKIAKDFYAFAELTEEPEDILILGSLVGYNWTPQSDIDLHILIDIEKERIDPKIARNYLNGLAFKWNTEHKIEIRGKNVEVYLQDIRETNHSIGAYSIMENRWIRKPCPQRVVLDKEKIQQKYTAIKNQIDKFIESKDVEKLKGLMKSIRNYRQAGLDAAGEFSTENVVFKALRHSGQLRKLKDAINSLYDKQISISEKHLKNENISLDYINGIIDNNLQIFSNRDSTRHLTLSSIFHVDSYKRWKYKPETNLVLWWENPTKEEKNEVDKWIKKVYNENNIEHISYNLLTIKEDKNVPNIWIGYTDDDTYETHALKTLGGKTHRDVPGYGSGHGKKRWRWRDDLNFVFWWETPNKDEMKAAEMWIKEYTGADIHNHFNAKDFGPDIDDIGVAVHNPHQVLGYYRRYRRKMDEEKHDPFKMKEMWFVTYGGISPTKQKGYDPNKLSRGFSMHAPPTRSGFYAFVWPFMERFLLGGSSFVDPKARGKGSRNRIQFVRDKEGNVITQDHPDFEKLSTKDKNWTLTRTKDNQPEPEDFGGGAWTDFKHMLYRPSARKKFKYDGPLWHHLGEHLSTDKILDKRGEWVKTSMESYKEALRKELISMKKRAHQYGISGVKGTTMDHLEVFIDQKV